jgi:hypothetical protein
MKFIFLFIENIQSVCKKNFRVKIGGHEVKNEYINILPLVQKLNF